MPTKLGPHQQRPTPQARQLVEAGAACALLVDDFGPAAEYLQLNPDIVLVGRVYTPRTYQERLADAGGSPMAAAARFVQEQMPIYRANPLIKRWVGLNEESFGGPDDAGALQRMADYAVFEAERAEYMAAEGLQAAVGGFSTGYPEINKNDLRMWLAFLPALEAAKRFNGLLHLHEYAAPFMWWWTFHNANPDMQMGWLTLRYRQVYEFVLRLRGLVVPLFISECGCDRAGGGSPKVPTGNWRDLAPWWATHGEPDAETFYAEQFIWYDGELRKDSYVVGAAMFNSGWASPQWERYEWANAPRFVARLVEHIHSQRDVQDEPGDPGSGGGDMAKFKAGDRVQTTRNTPILNALGATLGSDLPAGTVATVRSGPHGVQNSSGTFWLLDLPDREDGYANENRLQLWVESNPPGEQGGRDIDVRLAHHDGAGHHIYSTPGLDQGYLKKGDGHDAVLEWQGGGFAHAVGYSWNDRVKTWVFQIERNPGSLWGGAAQFGYVEYVKNGGQPNQMNRLEVAVRDGQPVPNFDVPPSSQPPTPPRQPPTEPEPPTTHPPVAASNLLVNGSFEQGPGAGNWPGFPGSGVRVNGWELEAWAKPGNPKLEKQDQDWRVPEILPVQYQVQFPEDHLRYDDGQWVLKVFARNAPTMAQFGQTVDLAAGDYRFTVPVFPDQWHRTPGGLVRPSPQTSADYYLASEVRFWIEDIFDSGWLDARSYAIGQYTPRNIGFSYPLAGPRRFHIAMRGRWGFENNGWFLDGVTLIRIGNPTEPPEEPPTEPTVSVDIEPELARIESARAAFNAIVDEQIALIRGKVSNG